MQERYTETMISIETRRHSAVIRAFLEAFPSAEVTLDGNHPSGAVTSWCTNATLKNTINFSLAERNTVILGFHDGPWDMWAADEALPLVKMLSEKGLLRFEQQPDGTPRIKKQRFTSELVMLNLITFVILYLIFGFHSTDGGAALFWTLWRLLT